MSSRQDVIMAQPLVRALSYIGFTSPRADEWAAFGPGVLGLEAVDGGPEGAVRLRNDDAVQRICGFNGYQCLHFHCGHPDGRR